MKIYLVIASHRMGKQQVIRAFTTEPKADGFVSDCYGKLNKVVDNEYCWDNFGTQELELQE